MSFPPAGPYQGQQPTVPQFGLPRRLPAAEDAGIWGLYTPGQAEAPKNPAAPSAASGDWGISWGRDDRRGRRDGGAPAAHNPFAVQRPEFVQQVVVEESDPLRSSLLVVDNRDERIISPFQNWLVEEIISNAASSINVLPERDQVMPPNSGYHCCSPFANYTLDGIKAVLLFTMTSRTGGPCAQWDSYASSRAPGFSVFYMAGRVRHLGHLCGREGLQWK